MGGGPNGIRDDHGWTTFAALHPGIIMVVAKGGIGVFNGGRSKNRENTVVAQYQSFVSTTVFTDLQTAAPAPASILFSFANIGGHGF